MWVDDPNVSRRHATLRRRGSGYLLADGGSRNGTFVNERWLEGATVLSDGDQVRVGGTTLVFRQAAATAPPQRPEPDRPRAVARRRNLGKILAISAVVSVLGIVANSLATLISHSGNQWFRWLLAPAVTVVVGLASTLVGEVGTGDHAETMSDGSPVNRGRAPAPRRDAGQVLAGLLTVLLVVGVGGLAVTAGVRAVVGHYSSVNRLSGPTVAGGNSKVRLTVTKVLQGSGSTSVQVTGVNTSNAMLTLPVGFAHLTGSDGTTLDVDVFRSHWSTQLTPGVQQQGTLKFKGRFEDTVTSVTLSFTFGDAVSVKKIPLVPSPS